MALEAKLGAATGRSLLLAAVMVGSALAAPTSAGAQGFMRGAMLGSNVRIPTETAMLRREQDYANLADMIEGEIRILNKRTREAQAHCDTLRGDLNRATRQVKALAAEDLGRRRAEVQRLRREINSERRSADERVSRTDREIETTRKLREGVEVEHAGLDDWRAKELALRTERDRLRLLLRRIDALSETLE